MTPSVVPRDFYRRDPRVVAPELLNKVLVHGSRSGRIVEAEAYCGLEDPGAHSYRGMTARNQVMFGPPGRLYVYFTYGMHWCANAVCGDDGVGVAVLIRALAPLSGLEEMWAARAAARRDRDLCSGPAKLCQALGLDRRFDGADLVAGDRGVTIVDDGTEPPARPGQGLRIGLSAGAEHPWRWWVQGEPNVSRPEPRVVVPVAARSGPRLCERDDQMLAPTGDLAVARAHVDAAQPGAPDHEAARQRMLAFVDSRPDALHRSCLEGHLTGSAMVVDPASHRFLLLLHAKVGLWVQPGGHADGDAALPGVALKEATEETGIAGLRVAVPAVDLDVHEFVAPGEPRHLHFDVRYLVVAPPGAEPVRNHESRDLGWFSLDELPALRVDRGTIRMAHSALSALHTLPS